jgi:hypothetical protein
MAHIDNVHFAAIARLEMGRAVMLVSRSRRAQVDENGVRTLLEHPSTNLKPGAIATVNQKDVNWHLSTSKDTPRSSAELSVKHA